LLIDYVVVADCFGLVVSHKLNSTCSVFDHHVTFFLQFVLYQNMDRSWLKADRRTREFENGVDDLLMFAFENGYNEDKISCPCLKCAHSKSWKARIVKNHLFQNGIDETYTRWIWHGEPNIVESPVLDESDNSVSSNYQFCTRMGEADDDDVLFLRILQISSTM